MQLPPRLPPLVRSCISHSRGLELLGKHFPGGKKRHHRFGTAPLDLVLDGYECDPDVHFDGSLQSAVRARVTQNAIRQAHLRSDDGETVAAIIYSLTPGDDEATQNQNIESIVWENEGVPPVDISNFFARSRLSKLHLLDLSGNFRISSWDYLTSQTTLLTILSLQIDESPPSPTPTTSNSILASNPNLQQLTLSDAALSSDVNGSTLKMSLRNLKLLSLGGGGSDPWLGCYANWYFQKHWIACS